MELSQISTYFDRLTFDAFTPDAGAGSWATSAFVGQLKPADYFVSIWNRPTRRRMLTTGPGAEPPTKVCRVPETGDIFLVGTVQRDIHNGEHYRSTMNLHHAASLCAIVRRYPNGAASNPGYDADHTIQQTYCDLELRTQKDDADTEFITHGNFYVFLPGGSPLLEEDFIVINGTRYFTEVVYDDSGHLAARVTDKPDERVDLVYTSIGTKTYNDTTGAVSLVSTPYNVTAKLEKYVQKEEAPPTPNKIEILMHVKAANLPNVITPKIGDTFAYGGSTWRVAEVSHDALKKEWTLAGER